MSAKTQKALRMLKNGRASSSNNIAATTLKTDNTKLALENGNDDVENPIIVATTLNEPLNMEVLGTTPSSSSLPLSTDVVCTIIRNEFENMRKALTCSICLCTYRDAVILTTCIHSYCRDCVTKSMKSSSKGTKSKCPQCQVPCTRRSIMDAPNVNIQVKLYKQAVRKFGLAPRQYTPTIASLTQLVDSDDDSDDDKAMAHEGDSKKERNRRRTTDLVAAQQELLASKTFARVLRQQQMQLESDPTSSSDKNKNNMVWLKEQEEVVAANEKCLVQVAVRQNHPKDEPTFSQLVAAVQDQEVANNNFTQDDNETQFYSAPQTLPSQSVDATFPSQPIEAMAVNGNDIGAQDRSVVEAAPFAITEDLSPIQKADRHSDGPVNEPKETKTSSRRTSLTNSAVAMLRRNRQSTGGASTTTTSIATPTKPPAAAVPRNATSVSSPPPTIPSTSKDTDDRPYDSIQIPTDDVQEEIQTVIPSIDRISSNDLLEEIEVVINVKESTETNKSESNSSTGKVKEPEAIAGTVGGAHYGGAVSSYTSMTKKAARISFGKQAIRARAAVPSSLMPDDGHTKLNDMSRLVVRDDTIEVDGKRMDATQTNRSTSKQSDNEVDSDPKHVSVGSSVVDTSRTNSGITVENLEKKLDFVAKAYKDIRHAVAQSNDSDDAKGAWGENDAWISNFDDIPTDDKQSLDKKREEMFMTGEGDPGKESDEHVDGSPKKFTILHQSTNHISPTRNILTSPIAKSFLLQAKEHLQDANTDMKLSEEVSAKGVDRPVLVETNKVASMVQAFNSRTSNEYSKPMDVPQQTNSGRKSISSLLGRLICSSGDSFCEDNGHVSPRASSMKKGKSIEKLDGSDKSRKISMPSTAKESNKENSDTLPSLGSDRLSLDPVVTNRKTGDKDVVNGRVIPLDVITNAPDSTSNSSHDISVGSIVEVQARTWPGVNQQGGVAKVEAIQQDGSDGSLTYDVRYVLDKRREKKVDAVFVKLQVEIDGEMNIPSQSNRRSSEGSAKSRGSRRLSPRNVNSASSSTENGSSNSNEFIIPAELRAELAKQGCDVIGTATKSALDKMALAFEYGSKDVRSKDKIENHTKGPKVNDQPSTSTRVKAPVKAQTKKLELKARAKEDAELAKARSEVWHKKGTKKRKSDEFKPTSNSTEQSKPAAKVLLNENSQKKRKGNESAAIAPVVPVSSGTTSLTLLPNSVVCREADAYYERCLSAAIAKGSVSLVSSFLCPEDRAFLKELCKQSKSRLVKVSLTEDFKSLKTVLCVMPATLQSQDGKNIVANMRSMKAMQACLDGVPIVSASWLEACRKASNQFVLPDSSMYVRSLPTKSNVASNAEFGVAKLAVTWARSREKGSMLDARYTPFQGVYIYLCGFSCKHESEFSALARHGGAKEVITKPLSALAKLKAMQSSENSKYVVLCNDTNSLISDALEKEIRSNHATKDIMVVNSFWLFDSISCAEPLPPTSFKPHGCKVAKELWKMTCQTK